MDKKNLRIDFFQNIFIRRDFKISLFLISISILVLVFKFKSLPPSVPFFYSLPWGESQLALKINLFLIPLFSIITLLTNSYLARKNQDDILLVKLLMAGGLLFSLLATITLVKIIFLVS